MTAVYRGEHMQPQTSLGRGDPGEHGRYTLWTGDWTGGRVHPWGMDTAPIRKLWWLASDGTVNQLPWYCLDDCSRRVCSRWLREIDICELQGCWSAAPALCADAVRQVDFAQLWSRREVEARPSSAWAEPTSSVCRP